MKQIIASAILMAAGAAYASTPALYECLYRYDMTDKSTENGFTETSNCILLIGEDQSKFYDYPTFRLDSVSAIPGVSDDVVKKYREDIMKSETYFEQEVNTSLPANKINVFCDMAPERYKYEQQLPLITWEETEDTDTVCGYLCKKAIGNYGGKKWTAWYSEEIAIPFGPWKIFGLPGLVLKATDNEGNHNFEAIAFRQGSGAFSPSKIPNQISIKHDKFIELKNEYDRNPEAAINPESISGIEVTREGNILINGVRSRLNKKKLIPLEFTVAELNKTKKEKDSKAKSLNEIEVIRVDAVRKQ